MSPDDRSMGAVDAVMEQFSREVQRAGDLGMKLSIAERFGCIAISLLGIIAAQSVVQSELLELILAEQGKNDGP